MLLLTGAQAGAQQTGNASPVEQRANDVMSLFRADPGNYEKYFSKDFLDQVTPDKLTGGFTLFYSSFGRVVKIEPLEISSPYHARFSFITEKKMSIPVTVTVEEAEPHLISGLWLGNPTSISGTLTSLTEEFKSLPGESSFLIAKLNGDKLETVAAHNSERALAIGSAFKLYILSELIRSVNKGERKWSDVVTLKPEAMSLPSGMLQGWPTGSPVTLHTLASLMISISDNTATDQLLYTLGRENVERMLAATGHSKPELDMPFLSTGELFRLKGEPGRTSARAYLAKTQQGRRDFLRTAVSQIRLESINIFTQPTEIESLEWFASSLDLCRVMSWIRLNTETGPGMDARRILSINPGISISKERWKYVGFKGGSEPGVMSMTYLLQSARGDWYAVSASWNNKQAPVDEARLAGLVGRVIELIP
jgi:hypothetical protein